MKNISPEREIEKMAMNEQEERQYIMLLNRNIKDESKNKKTKEFVDLEDYFSKEIEGRIAQKEQSMKHQPIDFKT